MEKSKQTPETKPEQNKQTKQKQQQQRKPLTFSRILS